MRFPSAIAATLGCVAIALLTACGNATNDATNSASGWSGKAVPSVQATSRLVGGFSDEQRKLYILGIQHVLNAHQRIGTFTIQQVIQEERGREQQRQAVADRARRAAQARAASQAASVAASSENIGELQQFDSEDAAQSHCPRDEVVWLNTNSGIYHEKGMRWYGNTEYGAYVCRNEADAAGDRLTENGQ